MGKMKSKRKKLHLKAAKATKNGAKAANKECEIMETSDQMEKVSNKAEVGKSHVFSKVDIDMNALTKQLPGDDDLDTKSVVTSKSFRGINIKKKDKRKLKHEFWMKKVDVLQTMKTEARDKKKRERTVIVGDMKALADTLPTLDLLLRDCGAGNAGNKDNQRNNTSKTKSIQRESQRKKNMMSDISLFQQVLQHPAYKKNPKETITEHLRNKLKQEDMNT